MKNAKKILALLLVVIALFSVMTIAVSAGEEPADPTTTVAPVSEPDPEPEHHNLIVEAFTGFVDVLVGFGVFVARVVAEPFIWVLNQFGAGIQF